MFVLQAGSWNLDVWPLVSLFTGFRVLMFIATHTQSMFLMFERNENCIFLQKDLDIKHKSERNQENDSRVFIKKN